MASAGGVFRRCGCADPATGRQLDGSCPRLAADGHGSWYIQLELPTDLDGGRRRIRRGGYPSSDTAEAVLASLRMPAPGDPHADVLTVGDWLAHWLVSRTSPATSTMRSYSAHVRLYLAPYLGPVLVGELSAAHVQAMFTAIIRRHQALGTPISAATLNRIRATLRAALNAAMRRGLVSENAASRRGLGGLAADGRLPQAWIAPHEIRELRELTRYSAVDRSFGVYLEAMRDLLSRAERAGWVSRRFDEPVSLATEIAVATADMGRLVKTSARSASLTPEHRGHARRAQSSTGRARSSTCCSFGSLNCGFGCQRRIFGPSGRSSWESIEAMDKPSEISRPP